MDIIQCKSIPCIAARAAPSKLHRRKHRGLLPPEPYLELTYLGSSQLQGLLIIPAAETIGPSPYVPRLLVSDFSPSGSDGASILRQASSDRHWSSGQTFGW